MSVLITWENHIVVNITNDFINCNPNEKFSKLVPDKFSFSVTPVLDNWFHYRCSVSLPLQYHIQKINNQVYFNQNKFIISRNDLISSSSNFTIKLMSTPIAGGLYIRELRLYNLYLDYIDLKNKYTF